MLLWASAHTTQAADRDFADASSGAVPTASVSVQRQVGGLAVQYRPEDVSRGLSNPVDTSLSSLPGRFCCVFDGDPLSDRARRTQREVFLRNSDSLVRAKVRLSLGREWLFVYADMGTGNSPLRWQGLVGIRVGQETHLLGGWRRMTYDLSPGGEFDALDVDGPFIGVQRAW